MKKGTKVISRRWGRAVIVEVGRDLDGDGERSYRIHYSGQDTAHQRALGHGLGPWVSERDIRARADGAQQ